MKKYAPSAVRRGRRRRLTCDREAFSTTTTTTTTGGGEVAAAGTRETKCDDAEWDGYVPFEGGGGGFVFRKKIEGLINSEVRGVASRGRDDGDDIVWSIVLAWTIGLSDGAILEDLRGMSLNQLRDMRTIPCWDLVHNPPGRNPRGVLVSAVTRCCKQLSTWRSIVPKYRKRWKFMRKFMAFHKISPHKDFMVREIIRRKVNSILSMYPEGAYARN
ncbi:hypothetical protein ACHAXA_010389 [Cyclostephanos tholiformis]|uniref:Uncharacterized protein n=1 Tax=Cyclostephanos tholiformis TaxID=382380 RepID=A0ABD3RDF3_9STRA